MRIHHILLLILLILIIYYVPTTYIVITILLVGIVLGSMIIKIETAYFGVETIFGKRTNRVLTEGLRLKTPFVGEVILFSMELVTYTFYGSESAVVYSSDNQELTIDGSVQLRPSQKNLRKFVEITEDTIKNGMKDAIESGLGIIAGQELGTDFIRRRQEIELIINCSFLLERRPDFYVNKPDTFKDDPPKSFIKYLEKLEKKKEKYFNSGETKLGEFDKEMVEEKISKIQVNEWDITKNNDGTLNVLDFYKKNIRRITTMLQFEELIEGSSEIENLYAIDIATFKLSKVSYSPETKKSLEKEKQAENDLKAFKLRQKNKLSYIKKLKLEGVDPNKADDSSDVAVGMATKQVISGNIIPLVNVGGGK